jgi:hypothetical protein
MKKQDSNSQLGQAVISYGKVALSAVVVLLGFCVWAVPNYLIAQRDAVAEQRYCTKQEATDAAKKEAREVETRFNARIERMENKLDRIYEWVTKP